MRSDAEKNLHPTYIHCMRIILKMNVHLLSFALMESIKTDAGSSKQQLTI